MSTGERLVPYLFAALEACCIDALLIRLTDVQVMGSSAALVPLWMPFVAIAFSCWMTRQYKRHLHSFMHGSLIPVIVLNTLVTLFLAWLTLLVAQQFMPEALYDFPLFDSGTSQSLFGVILTLVLCWRGVVIAQRNVDSRYVAHALGWGAGIFTLVIITGGIVAAQQSATYDSFPLLMLILFFASLSLVAHTLSHLIYTRRYHTTGLQGDIARQERAALRMVAVLCCLFLLLTLLAGSLISPTLLSTAQHPLGTMLEWLVSGIGTIINFLLTPIGWLWNILLKHLTFNPASPTAGGGPLSHGGKGKFPLPPPQYTPRYKPLPSSESQALAPFLSILQRILPFLLLATIIILLVILIHRLKRRPVEEDIRESLWSWQLFWSQLIAFLRSLLAFFFPALRSATTDESMIEEDRESSLPAARNIRDVYRLLLKQAAKYGCPRRRDETPYEFESRLRQQFPLIEPELSVITETYTLVRYSGMQPDEYEVARVRDVWRELESKWRV